MLTQPNTETNIKLPFSFIFFSLVAFALAQCLLLWKGTVMLDGAFRQPILWAAAHLLLLGWALMATMGAMYQLVPVAFLTPIWSERLGFVQFTVTSLGIISFSATLGLAPHISYIGGGLTLIGILLFLLQMVMTLKVRAEKNILFLFVGTALLCLFATIFLGIILALNMGGLLPLIIAPEALLHGHVLLGLCGWFTLLIFGFSYKMVPMFSLAHGFEMKRSKLVFGTYALGLTISFISLFNKSPYMLSTGLFVLFIGFLLFSIHIRQILVKRVKKKLDRPFVFSLMAILFGLFIHFLAVIASVISPTPWVFGSLALAYIMSWIVFSIVGYLIKIVPFLWWTHRYSQKVGKENTPALKDMMDEKIIQPILIVFPVAFAGIALSFIIQNRLAFLTSQAIFTAATIVFCFLIMRILKK